LFSDEAGGDNVAKEIVQAIDQAEQEAAQIEKEASVKAEAIISKAKEDGKSLINAMTNEVLAKAEQDLNQAKAQVDEIMEAAVKKAEEEIFLLKENVKGREQAAVDFILSELI
jgi:V/A-type H+/Na+-transporting ATPase subunit G/H